MCNMRNSLCTFFDREFFVPGTTMHAVFSRRSMANALCISLRVCHGTLLLLQLLPNARWKTSRKLLRREDFVFVWTALLIYWQVFRIYTHVSEDKSDVLTSSILFVFFLVGHVIVVETMFNVLLQMQLLHAMCLCTNHQIFEAAFIFGQNVGNAIFWYHEIVSLPKCSHSDSQTEGLAFFHGVSLCLAGQRWLSFKFATQLSEL